MKKDLIIGAGVGIPVIIIMIVIGGGGHTSLDFEDETVIEEPNQIEPIQLSQDCSGTARCITGTVTKIIKGDVIHVDSQVIKFALASAPNGYGEKDSRDFIQTICPVGSTVLVDEDDSQIEENNNLIIGMVFCNGVNLNAELLDASLGYLTDQFCDSSEFAEEFWAKKHGC